MLPIICPICKEELVENEHSWVCSGGHCYDKARSGYLNLLPPSGSGHHGDDRLMVKARTDFLEKGFYTPLRDAVSGIAAELGRDDYIVLDAGCGEGYYSLALLNAIRESHPNATMIGVDISKYALMALRKRSREIMALVSSTASLPVKDASCDLVVNIFSPLFSGEFGRVLKKGGHLLRVVPLEDHLLELKQAIYDTAYLNDPPVRDISGFDRDRETQLRFPMHLATREDIISLFQMTPYYYKTSVQSQERAQALSELDITAAFEIQVFRKA